WAGQGNRRATYSGFRPPPIAGEMDAPRGSQPAPDLAGPRPRPPPPPAPGRRARALRASRARPEREPDAAPLEAVGRELGAHRVYVFENVRDPDGRLWMNLADEWRDHGGPGLFGVSGAELH